MHISRGLYEQGQADEWDWHGAKIKWPLLPATPDILPLVPFSGKARMLQCDFNPRTVPFKHAGLLISSSIPFFVSSYSCIVAKQTCMSFFRK